MKITIPGDAKVPARVKLAASKATLLKRKMAMMQEELDCYKNIIREWAGEVMGHYDEIMPEHGVTSFGIPTDVGTCMVTFPKDKAVVKTGKELHMLRSTLAPSQAHLVIIEKLDIAPGLQERLGTNIFDQWETKHILNTIEWQKQTIRVEPAK